MSQEQQPIPFVAMLAQLRELCDNRSSGVMLVTTPDGRRIQFRLRKGVIIDVRYAMTQGLAALAAIQEVKEGRQRFFMEEESKSMHDLKVLPSSKDILFLLGLPLDETPNQYGFTDRDPWTMDRLKADTGRMIPLADIVEMLRFSRVSQLSAVLFFITAERRWFEFVLKGGEIVDATAHARAGLAAIRAFKDTKGATYSIRLRRCSEATDYEKRQPLPSTIEILRFLTKPAETPTGDGFQAHTAALKPDTETPEAPEAPEAPETPKTPEASSSFQSPSEKVPDSDSMPESAPSEETETHSPSSQPAPVPQREAVTEPQAQGIGTEDERHGFSPILDILKQLRELCQERQTGIMIVVRSDKRGLLEFFVDQGRISDIVCQRLHGVEALQLAKEVTSGRYSFTARRTPARQRDLVDLPPNEEIFYQLGLPLDALGISQKSQEPVASAVPEQQEVQRKKILVVDDSSLTRKIVAKTLMDQGYAVIEAEDGEHALSQVRDERPDLLLLDLIMPGMDGYQVLSAVRRGNEETKRIPVILLTSRDKLFNKIKGKMAGSDEYLTKPFKPDELLLKIRKYVG